MIEKINFFSTQLNPRQKEAVDCLDGPILILAGAGSGKTRVLTYRMANLILQKKSAPDEILCMTFTNKAAQEMRKRIEVILSDLDVHLQEKLWVSTFHSFCVRILRQNIHLLGYSPQFLIYDQTDQLNLIKTCFEELKVDPDHIDPKAIQQLIQKVKNLGLNSQSRKLIYHMNEQQKNIYTLYEKLIKESEALDFNDLLLKTHEIFEQNPSTLESYQNKFKYIMIDEYQDTNHIQYRLIKQLSQNNKNLCIVGDEDQSIYSWRGADYSNITKFKKDFSKYKLIKLEENYRSSQNIVEATNCLISQNQERSAKTLFTSNPAGEKIFIHQLKNEYEEATFVAESIEKELQTREAQEISIFYRTNAQSRVLEEELRRRNVKYKIIGGIQFYQRKEIKDVLCYMRLLINPKDNVAFLRVINTPLRGIGKTTVKKLEVFARERSLSLYEALTPSLETDIFTASTRKKFLEFYKTLEEIKELIDSYPPHHTYHKVLQATDYREYLRKKYPAEARSKDENLEALFNAFENFEKKYKEDATLHLFLEELALLATDDEEPDDNCVSLMTLHSSKGLEFPVVFIVGCNEGLFPSNQSIHADDHKMMEEERRLAYVGMTRAQEKLLLSYANIRRNWGTEVHSSPSRFLAELPDEYVEHLISSYSYASSSSHHPPYKKKAPSHASHASFSQNNWEEEDWSQTHPDEDENPLMYKKGMKIIHPQFGRGIISSVEGQGESEKLQIIFNNRLKKKFMSKYIKLQKL